MKLYELIKTCDKNAVIEYLAKIDDRNGPSVYSEMLEKLIDMTPAESSDTRVLVCKQQDLFDSNSYYYDVSGVKDGDENFYALEFTPWNIWLASEVVQKPIDEYGLTTVIGEIMYEMSFISFDENEIQENQAAMVKQCEEIKNGTAKLYPLEISEEDAKEAESHKEQIGEITQANRYKRKAMLD